MRSIGIRVEPKIIHYSIVESDNENNISILDVNRLYVPQAPEMPFVLSFIRTNLFSIIEEYKINTAGIRIPEKIAQCSSTERTYMEGVIQELLTDSNIENFFVGRIAKIASNLDIEDRNYLKKCFSGKESFSEIKNWDDYIKNAKESLATSLAANQLEVDKYAPNE